MAGLFAVRLQSNPLGSSRISQYLLCLLSTSKREYLDGVWWALVLAISGPSGVNKEVAMKVLT